MHLLGNIFSKLNNYFCLTVGAAENFSFNLMPLPGIEPTSIGFTFNKRPIWDALMTELPRPRQVYEAPIAVRPSHLRVVYRACVSQVHRTMLNLK